MSSDFKYYSTFARNNNLIFYKKTMNRLSNLRKQKITLTQNKNQQDNENSEAKTPSSMHSHFTSTSAPLRHYMSKEEPSCKALFPYSTGDLKCNTQL